MDRVYKAEDKLREAQANAMKELAKERDNRKKSEERKQMMLDQWTIDGEWE